MMRRLAAIVLLSWALPACAMQVAQPEEPPRALGETLRIISIEETIFTQMREKGCWNEAAIAQKTERVTFRVYFTSDGHLSKPPELIAPTSLPAHDPPLMALADRALRALEACDAQGFDLPDYYSGKGPPRDFDLTFPDMFAFERS